MASLPSVHHVNWFSTYARLIEYPAQGQVNYALAIIFAGETVELSNFPQILSITAAAEISEIVATDGFWSHPAAQPTPEGAVGQRRHPAPEAIRQHVFFAFAFK